MLSSDTQKTGGLHRKCAVCGLQFTKEVKGQFWCSDHCRVHAHDDRQCLICLKMFTPSRVDRHFCSSRCNANATSRYRRLGITIDDLFAEIRGDEVEDPAVIEAAFEAAKARRKAGPAKFEIESWSREGLHDSISGKKTHAAILEHRRHSRIARL
jgi:predicted nucleic acid-binding Zn ribbon protein